MKNKHPLSFLLKDVKVDKDFKSEVQVCRTGKDMVHAVYGKFSITKKDLQDMHDNFLKNARGLMEDGKPVLQFDYQHEDAEKAAGWIEGLRLSENGEELFATVSWTPAGAEVIRNKEFKFVSPAIESNWTNNSTNEEFRIILKGAGLTNIPFLTEMNSITLLSESKKKKYLELLALDENSCSFEQIMTSVADLSEEQLAELMLTVQSKSKIPNLRKDMSEETDKLNETLTEKTKELTETNSKLELAEKKIEDSEAALALKEKETTFMKMLSEGKAVPAQKEAFLAGDIAKFAELSVDVNLDSEGSGGGESGDEIKTAEGAEDKLIELAEALVEKDEVPFSFALKQVRSDKGNAKLVQLSEK